MEIDKLWEKTKIRAFLYKDASFLGTILTRLKFIWDESFPTAATNGKQLRWNPDWFMSLPEDTRVTILLHELWHVGRLHNLRVGTRDKELWNIACDFRINNDLRADGYSFEGTDGLLNDAFDYPERLTEEQIYDFLVQQNMTAPESYQPDLENTDSQDEQETLQIVQQAQEFSRSCGNELKGDIQEILAQNLKPKVPWNRLLRQYFMDMIKDDYSWKKPNRRYEDIYLPSLCDSESLLTVLNYYIDTSGSIDESMLIRFNAELKSIWQDLKPAKLRIINFDTKIQKVEEITQDKPYEYKKFKGRGGTSLKPVYEHIKETKPVAAIIFSDLECSVPREKPKCPVIWVVVDNPKKKPPYGKVVHIPREELTSGSKR